MGIDHDTRFLLNVQQALLSQVTPALRSVSGDIDLDRRVIRLRFIFARQPSDSEQDAASIAAAQIIADCSDSWQLDEEYPVVPQGERMSYLRLLAYHRCEDDWVSPTL